MTIQTPDPLQTKTMEIVTVDVGLPATERCDRCGAQAYIEVEIMDTGEAHLKYKVAALRPGTPPVKRELLYCVHHYTQHEDALVLTATKIVDHRPFLAQQEAGFKNVTTP